MKKNITLRRISSQLLVLGLALLFAENTFADAVTPLKSPTPAVGTLYDFIVIILGIVIKISIPILTVFFIYTGFLFVSAEGDVKKLTDARRMFTYGVIGAAIVLGSVLIATVVNGTLTQITS